MRHYCNRQNMRRRQNVNNIPSAERTAPSEENADITARAIVSEENDEPVFPPGCDYSSNQNVPRSPDMPIISEASDISDMTEIAQESALGQGGAVSQMGGYGRQLDIDYMQYNECSNDSSECGTQLLNRSMYTDNMSGNFGVMPVPQQSGRKTALPMSSYISSYRGKYICLDLWSSDCRREELCGILTDVGSNYLVLQRERDGEMTMVDLRTVRYINIYFR